MHLSSSVLWCSLSFSQSKVVYLYSIAIIISLYFCVKENVKNLKLLAHACITFYSSLFSLCRLRELHTLKGHVESVVRLKGLDIDTIQQSYTV